jgi:hypothetical protein
VVDVVCSVVSPDQAIHGVAAEARDIVDFGENVHLDSGFGNFPDFMC